MAANSQIGELVVTTVRVVAHTMGPVQQGGVLSQNHWSIYLVTAGKGSVRLNMSTNPNSANDVGTFTVTQHAYETSGSAVKFFDYQAAPNIKVSDILKMTRDNKRHQYKMTPTGVGCRHWVYASH